MIFVNFLILKNKVYLTEENSCFVILRNYLNERLCRHCKFPHVYYLLQLSDIVRISKIINLIQSLWFRNVGRAQGMSPGSNQHMQFFHLARKSRQNMIQFLKKNRNFFSLLLLKTTYFNMLVSCFMRPVLLLLYVNVNYLETRCFSLTYCQCFF